MTLSKLLQNTDLIKIKINGTIQISWDRFESLKDMTKDFPKTWRVES